MLIILPPSETKAHGGNAAPLDFDSLSYPALNSIRRDIAGILSSLPVDEAMAVLGLSEKLRGEAESNKRIFTSPTMPAIERYTGVLYDALDAATLSEAARLRLAVGDALFGIVGAEDPIPHYRLSGATKLEGRTMRSRWGSSISDVLNKLIHQGELVVDMRSGTYRQLGTARPAVTVRVESMQPDGSRKVVSHFNKHFKGQLARILASAEDATHNGPAPRKASSIDDVATIANTAGLDVEVRGTELVIVTQRP